MLGSIFISYAREDAQLVDQLGEALERQGFEVWWDRKIPTGANYVSQITQALRNARHVLVLWSSSSIQSEWVYSEAKIAKDNGSLFPIQVTPVEPPPPFNVVQSFALAGQSQFTDEVVRRLVSTLQSRRIETVHAETTSRKRVLCLDTFGPSYSLVTCGLLEALEAHLRGQSSAADAFRLSDYFDLIVGTSLGAVIGAKLALGATASEVRLMASTMVPKVFQYLGDGLLETFYSARAVLDLSESGGIHKSREAVESFVVQHGEGRWPIQRICAAG